MMLWSTCGLLVALLFACGSAVRDLPKAWKDDIEDLKAPIKEILDYVQNVNKKQAYNRLAYLVDIYGPRLSGTPELEDAIDYMKAVMETEFGVNNVGTDDVEVPSWERGVEKAWINIPRGAGLTPRRHDMNVLTIGTSVGTGGVDLTGEIMVVHSLDDLKDCNVTNKFKDKIIVFNQPWPENGYLGVYMYRGEAGHRSDHCGAKAALVRSLTQLSMNSPHTGTQSQTLASGIPAVCITVEDAELLDRLTNMHNISISVKLNLGAEVNPRSQSRNLWAKIDGSEKPDEYVIFGGHIDSWDVGQGAMDDGGGVIVAWQALTIVNELVKANKIPKPRRTMKAIFWTAEEIDTSGAKDFFEKNKDKTVSLIMESDAGTFSPTGIGFSGSGLSKAILEEVMSYLTPIKADKVTDDMLGSVDLGVWLDAGRTAAVLNNVGDEYFKFHHTDGDTMTVEDPAELDRCSAMWTAVAYAVARLHDVLPTEGSYIASSAIPSVSTSWSLLFATMLHLILCKFGQ